MQKTKMLRHIKKCIVIQKAYSSGSQPVGSVVLGGGFWSKEYAEIKKLNKKNYCEFQQLISE